MRLTKIKLAGFKSFVDPTTIDFPSNLTGVVGPNGCGKSNIIDAVRWVMGELSAKTPARRLDGGRHLQRLGRAQAGRHRLASSWCSTIATARSAAPYAELRRGVAEAPGVARRHVAAIS